MNKPAKQDNCCFPRGRLATCDNPLSRIFFKTPDSDLSLGKEAGHGV